MSNLPASVFSRRLCRGWNFEGEPRECEKGHFSFETKIADAIADAILPLFLFFIIFPSPLLGMFRQSHDHHMILRLLRQPSGYTRIDLATSGGCCNGSLQLIRLLAIRIQDSHALTRGNETWTLLQKSGVWKQKEKPIGTIVIYHVSMFRNVPSILHRQIKSIPPSIPSGIFPCLQHLLVFGIAHPWESFLDASFWVEDSRVSMMKMMNTYEYHFANFHLNHLILKLFFEGFLRRFSPTTQKIHQVSGFPPFVRPRLQTTSSGTARKLSSDGMSLYF